MEEALQRLIDDYITATNAADPEAVLRALESYHTLAAESVERLDCLFLRNDQAPDVYDVNHVRRVRLATASIDDLLAEMDVHFAGRDYRSLRLDPWAPPAVEARLLQDGWSADVEIVLIAAPPLAGRPAAVEVRPVKDEEDWEALGRLFQLDHGEASLGNQMLYTARLRSPAFVYYLALADGRAVGHFSESAAGDYGYLENLFVEPAYRNRGIATALVHHAAAAARAKGARWVFLPALANDTPKEMYWRMGFRPLFAFRNYLKRLTPAPDAGA